MLLPVTGSFALPFSIYHIFLQVRVTFSRMATQTSLENTSKSSLGKNDDPLLAAFRAQGNFVENVPLALTLAAVVELNGGSQTVLIGALSALLMFRIAHAEYGLMVPGYGGRGRPVGFFGTAGVVLVLAAYGAWLVREFWGL